MRKAVEFPVPATIESAEPLGNVPPQRLAASGFSKVTNDHLRGLLLTAAEISYSKVAELAADTLLSREDITDADRGRHGVFRSTCSNYDKATRNS